MVADDPLARRLVEPVPGGFGLAVRSLVWFGLQVLAVAAGVWAVAVVFAAMGGVAAGQTVRTWRAAGLWASLAVAGWGTVIVVVASALSLTWAGVAVLGLVVAALVASVGARGRGRPVAVAGATVRSALGPVLAGVGVVQVAEVSWAAVLVMLVLVAGYDVACQVWSSDGAGPVVGRAVGVLTVAVLTVGVVAVHTVLRIEPFGPTVSVWVFGGLAATLCPLGPMLASALLPAADAVAPALRRLDSLVVVAPVWMVALWGYLA